MRKKLYIIGNFPSLLTLILTALFLARCEILEIPHMHNRVVHFPIGFSAGALIFEVLSFFNPSFQSSSHIMIGLCAISSFVSYLTGQKASESLQKKEEFKSKKETLQTHEALGFTLFIISSITFITKFIQKLKTFSSLLVFLCAIISFLSGYTGGTLSHK